MVSRSGPLDPNIEVSPCATRRCLRRRADPALRGLTRGSARPLRGRAIASRRPSGLRCRVLLRPRSHHRRVFSSMAEQASLPVLDAYPGHAGDALDGHGLGSLRRSRSVRSSWCTLWLVYAIVLVVWRLFRKDQVDTNAILGAIVAYVLAAVAFSSVFELIELAQPGSFTWPSADGVSGLGSSERWRTHSSTSASSASRPWGTGISFPFRRSLDRRPRSKAFSGRSISPS